MAHVLLGDLPAGRALREPGGQERVAALVGEALGGAEVAEPGQGGGPETGLLGQLAASQFLWAVAGPAGPAALGEGPGPPPDRVAVFLHQVETATLGRDDQREVGL